MPTEAAFLLAALFIVAGASGWALERFFNRDRENPRGGRISADYIRGLNLVLNRKTDEALELFVKIVKVDDDTLETHFALGHLFRRRGEVDRAIRVHQNLLARPSLSEAQRHQALFALADDYLGAGLFDRAEQLFAELASSESQGRFALERLVDIYEREREWRKAISALQKLERLTGESTGHIPHYYCELAEESRLAGDVDTARELLKHAGDEGSGALRSTFIGAVIEKDAGRYEHAIRLYERVVAADRRFVAELLPELMKCHQALGSLPRFDAYVERATREDPTLRNDFAYAAIVGGLDESPALAACIEAYVQGNEVLADLVNLDEVSSAGPAIRQRTMGRVARALRRLAMKSPRYRCTNCGYSTRKLAWHCPSCKRWETVRPIQSFQFEEFIT